MSSSSFFRNFKQMTTLSPLQFQKTLRLYEAQRLMLTNEYNVASAAYAVGYESSTQFIRENKRRFGDPPRRDVSRKRIKFQSYFNVFVELQGVFCCSDIDVFCRAKISPINRLITGKSFIQFAFVGNVGDEFENLLGIPPSRIGISYSHSESRSVKSVP